MKAEAQDTAPDSPARTVLVKHAQLLDEQIGQARLTRFRERMKAARDLAFAALAVLLLIGAGALMWSASRSSGTVITPFSTPPDLAEQGVTGAVIANRLLDRINEMQGGARSSRRARAARNRDNDEIRVEIPQTGVSIGEVWRLLRERLGDETPVSGEVFHAPEGTLGLTVRVAGTSLTTTGPEGDLAPLIDQAAERVFAETEPYRYASWLSETGRHEDAVAAQRALAEGGASDAERAWGYMGWSIILRAEGDQRGSVARARTAVRLNPELSNAWGQIGTSSVLLGHDEVYLETRVQTLRLERRGRANQDPRWQRYRTAFYEGDVARARGDMVGAVEAYGRTISLVPAGAGEGVWVQAAQAEALAFAHDLAGSRRVWQGSVPGNDGDWHTDFKKAELARGLIVEDWRGVAETALAPRPHAEPFSGQLAAFDRIYSHPWLAYAVARLGKMVEAEALIATTPRDCYLCVRTRGKIAALKGDRAAADRWFAEAVRQGPSLPFAHSEWGEAELARGDLDGAIAMFREAHARGPRWADPLKFWGDALAAEGDQRGAIRKYRAAAERAPRWGALHLAWGRALEATGRREAALTKYRQAARMDLSASDRTEVARSLRGPIA